MTDDGAAATFEPMRAHLTGLAYRMLGALSDAEDIVQDAFLRWREVDRATVAEPRAYLAKIVTRLCLDRAKSARARRELYVGSWLPEPIVDEAALAPDAATALARDLSTALLLVLERLSPLERAAFLLHDVFDMEFPAVADALGRSEPACRQLAARAREHVHDARPRFTPTPEASARLAGAFRRAMLGGDLAAIAALLANDAILHTDGGGKRLAALNPIYGKDKILRFFAGVAGKNAPITEADVRDASINGLPGFVIHAGGDDVETFALEHDGVHVTAIYAVRNPDKLRHLR